jgi:hypothetical protein
MIEEQTQVSRETSIPTPADVVDAVRSSVIVSGAGAEDFNEAFVAAFTSSPLETTDPDTALISLLAHASAAFEASKLCRDDGDDSRAGLYHAMGQDMLTRVAETLGAYMVIGFRVLGIPLQ